MPCGTGGMSRRPGARTAVVAIVTFLTTADGTVVNVALPSIQGDLRVSLPLVQWVVTSYLIAFSGLMLSGGRLADRYGRTSVLRLGLGLFTIASLGAGLAPTIGMLLAARAIQGAGAALALPAGLAVASVGPTQRDRDAAAAAWMASLATALALGPFIGGWLSQHLRWNWIFLVNLPVGLAGVLVAGHVASEPPPDRTARLDWSGLVCPAVILTCATFVLIDGSSSGWIAVFTAVLICAVSASLWRPRPMHLDRVLFGGIAASVLWGAGVTGVFFYTSLFLQRHEGFSATRTGLVFVPIAVCVVLATPLTAPLADRFGAACTVTAGLLLVSAGLGLLALVTHGSAVSSLALLTPAAVIGTGSALTVPLTTSVLAAVPPANTGAASGLLSVAREGSGLAGIGVLGLVVTAWGYESGLVIAAVLTVVGSVVAWRTLPGRITH
jgi:MFS family permease